MKNLVFAFALLCSTSLVAQFSYNDNGTGIQSSTNTASGSYSTAMGYNSTASGDESTAMGGSTVASGTWSTAMGAGTTASGYNSTAMGAGTTASGTRSTAMGGLTTASGNYSTAMGWNTNAQDYLSFVIGVHNKTDETPNPTQFSYQNTAFVIGNGGFDSNGIYDGHLSNAFEVLFDGSTTIAGNVTAPAFIGDGSQLTNMPLSFNYNGFGIQSATNTASGLRAIALGGESIASGYASTALGTLTEASGASSTAIGQETEASGILSTAMGHSSTASGILSTAMGYFSIARDRSSLVIGEYNKTDETPNPDNFSYQNTAFVIGNGTTDNNRSNAFKVLFDGTTTIAGDLNINSDARLKANIISLGATLSKLLQIDGKTYTMKKDANHKKKIGLLAQDIEKVFPELVTETNDIKSVNYQGLVPVLINAMKEQDEMIRTQNKQLSNQDAINKEQEAKLYKQQQEIDTYKKELEELKTMVKQLANR